MIKTDMPHRNSWLSDSGYSEEEQIALFNKNIQDILDNTRWYLDNLEHLRDYKVFWQCYSRKGITFPFEKEKVYK
jgi:hypothetical protein